ncbi:MAG: polyprenyl synthetase family protein [Lentisphaerae bacterium]|nr:polyprenyl synthetase family protein [Lentisphaerota bacterium]
MFDLQQYLDSQRRRINAALDQRLPAVTERPSALHQAMRYSVLAPGKRLRPVLCLAAAETIGRSDDTALTAALAIEILHTYTLIHDDLPSMDDDALRRGQKTLHIVAGEANAILAGDALLTLAFEWLAEVCAPPPYPPNQLSLELARAAGSRGLIGGQVEDLAAEGQGANADTVDYIHRHKTAELILATVRMGGIAAGATPSELAALSAYGENLGLAFQIVDDILNETATAAALGKAAGSDRARGKMTFVAVHGLEAARTRVEQLTREALSALELLPRASEPLAELARFISSRGC